MRQTLALLGLSMVLACSPATQTPAPPGASPPQATSPAEGPSALPAPTAATLQRLQAAAQANDYPALVLIAAESDGFRFSFGDDSDFATFLAAAEARGEKPAGDLVRVLAAPHVRQELEGEVLFIWPAVFAKEPATYTDEDRAEAATIIGPEQAAALSADNPYMGHRVAIDPQGNWVYFVKGD
jgi:hypothetical protein